MNFKTMQFFEPGDFLDLFANDMDPLPAKSFLFNLDYSKLSKHQASDRAFDLYRTFRKSPEAMDFYRRAATRPYSNSWALPSMELSHLILARIAEFGYNPARVPAAIFEESFFECPYRFLFFEPDFAQVDVEEIRAYFHSWKGKPCPQPKLALLSSMTKPQSAYWLAMNKLTPRTCSFPFGSQAIRFDRTPINAGRKFGSKIDAPRNAGPRIAETDATIL